MKYLKAYTESKIIIKKSEFIGILVPIKNDEDIKTSLDEAKKKYPKATHYVTAWVRGDQGQYASSNDDGEPSRTAGYPALEVLMKNEITDCLVIIIRYFGGVKLGAGGLIRAYSSSASETVNSAIFYKKVMARKYLLTFDYGLIDTVEHLLSDSVSYINKDYTDKVTYEIVFLKDDLELLKDHLHQIETLELDEEELHIDI